MTESHEDIKDPKPKPARKKVSKDIGKDTGKGVGVPFVLLCSGIATILGMTGGTWLGSTFSNFNSDSSTVQFVAFEKELNATDEALNALEKRLTSVEKKQKSLLNVTPSGDEPSDAASLGEDLTPLIENIESRLDALEKGKPERLTTIPADAPNDQTEDGSDIVVETGDEADGPSNLADNSAFNEEIMALRNSIAALETRLSNQTKRFVTVNQLKSVRDRVNAIEADFEKAPVLIPPFPRQAVMDAITGKTEDSGSWMSGFLGDEVRVVDAEIVSRLDRIETFVEAGNIDAIKKEVSYLPVETKPAIDSWLFQFDQGE